MVCACHLLMLVGERQAIQERAKTSYSLDFLWSPSHRNQSSCWYRQPRELGKVSFLSYVSTCSLFGNKKWLIHTNCFMILTYNPFEPRSVRLFYSMHKHVNQVIKALCSCGWMRTGNKCCPWCSHTAALKPSRIQKELWVKEKEFPPTTFHSAKKQVISAQCITT